MNTLYLKHESGATHALSGRRFQKLRKELIAGRGGPEVVALMEAGYEGYLATDGEIMPMDALDASVFQTQ